MKNERFLEDIKSKIDIVDFISGYVQLKKSGQNWKGICPFHSEKTPSFMVSQTKQIFHCFGCGAGGDVISFVAKHENLSFNEAVKTLAKEAGVPLPVSKAEKNSSDKSELIRNILTDATNFFIKKLQESENAKTYIKERGLSRESLELFKLGYAPSGWHNLLTHLRKSGHKDPAIKEAGVAVSGNKGLYDMFRNRMIFPITSLSGGIIAFGGRAMDDSTPKYINSPETMVFKKSDTLFALYHAKDAISKRDSVIFVEGYMDAIICHQHGFKNVVAPLGTSLTPGHLKKIRPFTNKTVLVFDGDSAGVAAAKRALFLICQNSFRPRVLLLPENEDPDSYLRKFGNDSFEQLLNKGKTMIEFLLSTSRGEKTDVIREVLTFIAEMNDMLMADEMLRELSDRTGRHETTIRQEFFRMKNKPVARKGQAIISDITEKNSEEYLLLSAAIAFPDKTDFIFSRICLDDIKDKTVISILGKISSLKDSKDIANHLDEFDEQEKSIITRLSVNPGFDLEFVDRNIEDCLRRIEKKKIDAQFLHGDISKDPNLSNSLLMEKKKMLKGPRL